MALSEREEISLVWLGGLAADGGSPVGSCAFGDEPGVGRYRWPGEYRAHRADRAALRRARRPKPSKLAINEVLRAEVAEKLADWWSPEQVSRWLRLTYPDHLEVWVSHETSYLSFFTQWKLTESASRFAALPGVLESALWRDRRRAGYRRTGSAPGRSRVAVGSGSVSVATSSLWFCLFVGPGDKEYRQPSNH